MDDVQLHRLELMMLIAGQFLACSKVNYRVDHPNGKPAIRAVQRDVIFHGTYMTYTLDGKVLYITTYSDGVDIGPWQLFDNAGNRTNIWEIENGVPNGPAGVFFADGCLYKFHRFVNGVIHGDEVTFRQDGTRMYTQTFVNGVCLDTITKYCTCGATEVISPCYGQIISEYRCGDNNTCRQNP